MRFLKIRLTLRGVDTLEKVIPYLKDADQGGELSYNIGEIYGSRYCVGILAKRDTYRELKVIYNDCGVILEIYTPKYQIFISLDFRDLENLFIA